MMIMTHYTRFIDNSEVIDVLYMLSLGLRSVKELSRRLKQPQPTVSTKIRYLVQNQIIKKKAWEFEINNRKLNSEFIRSFKEVIDEFKMIAHSGSLDALSRNASKIITSEISESILSIYAKMFVRGYRKLSVKDMVREFITSLSDASESEVRKLDPRLLKLRKSISSEMFGRKLLFEVSK